MPTINQKPDAHLHRPCPGDLYICGPETHRLRLHEHSSHPMQRPGSIKNLYHIKMYRVYLTMADGNQTREL